MGTMGIYFILFFSFFLIFTDSIEARCVSSFDTHPQWFNECLEHDCLLFISERPYVVIDPGLKETHHQRPFRWQERSSKWPNLGGPFFSFVEGAPALKSARLVWGGSNCTFDGMVSFVNATAPKTRHRLIVGGIMFNLQYRMGPHTIPSVPLTRDRLVIVGPRLSEPQGFYEAWYTIWQPFTYASWLYLVCIFLFMLLLRIIIASQLPSSCRGGRLAFWHNFLGEHNIAIDSLPTAKARHIRRSKKEHKIRLMLGYWNSGVKLLMVLLALLFEVAIAIHVFQEQSKTPIAGFNLEKFVVVRDTSEKYIFRRLLALGDSRRGMKEVISIDEAYAEIADSSTRFQYTVGYRVDNLHLLHYQKLCKQSQVYNTDQKLPTLEGGWYYSSTVPMQQRFAIDKDIMTLRENIYPFSNLEETLVGSIPSECSSHSRIGLPLLVLLSLLPGGIVICMVIRFIAELRREDESEQLSYYALPMHSCSRGSSGQNWLRRGPKSRFHFSSKPRRDVHHYQVRIQAWARAQG